MAEKEVYVISKGVITDPEWHFQRLIGFAQRLCTGDLTPEQGILLKHGVAGEFDQLKHSEAYGDRAREVVRSLNPETTYLNTPSVTEELDPLAAPFE